MRQLISSVVSASSGRPLLSSNLALKRLQNDSVWDRQGVIVILAGSVGGKGGGICRGDEIMPVHVPCQVCSRKLVWEREKKKRECVEALMTEKRFFKYTELARLLPRAYWLVLRGAIFEVLHSTKPRKKSLNANCLRYLSTNSLQFLKCLQAAAEPGI